MRITPAAALKLGLGLSGALACAGPALAHHSFAMFDHVHRVTVSGTARSM